MNYDLIRKQLISISEGVKNSTSILSNASALLNESMNDLNWVGFYLVDNGNLILGPFQGKIACTFIKCGNGVCGTALKEKKTILVPNVHKFPGHIACDCNSNSEIVIPIFKNNLVYGVLDIDSPLLNRFNEEDKLGLESFIKTLEGLL